MNAVLMQAGLGMKEPEAFVLALVLLAGATVITRRYLGRDARIALGAIAALAHFA